MCLIKRLDAVGRDVEMLRSRVLDGSILAFDIAGYSLRSGDRQKKAQTLCNRVRLSALAQVDPPIFSFEWLDAGDGGYLLLQGDVRSALHVVKAFVVELAEENSQLSADYQVHVRFAMHCGLVRIEETDSGIRCAGDAINETARLLDSMSRDHTGQVVCSGKYRTRLVDEAGEPAALFVRLEDITDKHGQAHEVWNVRQEPGFGVRPNVAELFGGAKPEAVAAIHTETIGPEHHAIPRPRPESANVANEVVANRVSRAFAQSPEVHNTGSDAPASKPVAPKRSGGPLRSPAIGVAIGVIAIALLLLLALQARRAHRSAMRANVEAAKSLELPRSRAPGTRPARDVAPGSTDR